MRKSAKIVSVILSLLMALTAFPIVVFAEEAPAAEEPGAAPLEDSAERVAGWKDNHKLLLNTLFDNSFFTSWSYVDQNQKALKDTMAAYTFFALYDEAWKNYVTKEVDVENAEKILLAIIEKANFTFDDGYVDEIIKVLDTAGDVNDFIQKVNKFIKNDTLASEQWGKAFKIIGDIEKIGNAYQNYREEFIEAYAKVLSVQLADAYYLDLLQYIVDSAENAEDKDYRTLGTAAANLIGNMQESIDSTIEKIVGNAAGDGVTIGADYLLNLAMNSNVYTATALKVYGVTKSIADTLWNTSAQYPHLATIKLAYYFQADAAEWAESALENEDEGKAVVAIDFLITTRKVCEEALKNLKLAESGGVVGKIKSKLYGNIFEDTEINVAALNLMKYIMFGDVDNFKKIVDALYIYCPVEVEFLNSENSVLDKLPDGKQGTKESEYGIYASVYSEYGKDYLKLAYLYDNLRIRLNGLRDGVATLILDKLADDGSVNDWSFTDVKINKNTKIVFDTDFTAAPSYIYNDGVSANSIKFNDEFVPSEHPEVTANDVFNAVVEVGKDETKSFLQKIKDFFQQILDFFRKLFRIKK